MGYIYLRTNKINGKKYVGQTDNFKRRNNEWNKLNKRYGGHVINNARKKYGADGFSFEILRECPNEEMNYWEMYYIKQYNSKKPYGYNATDGGDSTYERSEETRKKISEALKGKPNPKTAAARRGMKLSEEHKTKIGVASRGRKHSEETKEKIADAHRGRKCPEETKAKIADTLRGRKRPDIAAILKGKPKPKVAAALKGRKRPAEAVAKSAAAHRGMKRSEETKKKIADSKRDKYNTKCSKAVQALDKDGNVAYEFASTAEAQRHGFNSGCISQCCNGKLKSHKGFIWRYAV